VPPFVLKSHCHEYGAVPELGIDAVKVEVCPRSTVGLEVIEGAPGALNVELTVTDASVVGMAVGVGVAPPVVPVSVSVTVSMQFDVAPVGA
jgi:hypothetical protein